MLGTCTYAVTCDVEVIVEVSELLLFNIKEKRAGTKTIANDLFSDIKSKDHLKQLITAKKFK